MTDRADEERWAKILIDAIEGDDAAAFNAAITQLLPKLRQVILKATNSMQNCIPGSMDDEDVVQDVLIKMQCKGPRRKGTSQLATVLAWAKKAARNHLRDLKRHQEVVKNHQQAVKGKAVADSNVLLLAPRSGPLANLEHRRLIEAMHNHLLNVYPKGARYLDLGCFHIKRTEAAEMMGVSRANIDQIHKRTIDRLKHFRAFYAGEGK